MNSQDKWINDIESLASEMKQVDPSSELMRRLKNIPNQLSVVKTIPLKIVWAVAASIAILVMVNVYSLKIYNHSSETNSELETTESSYFSHMKHL